MESKRFLIGTAAWTIPPTAAALFPKEGSHLERYARVFNAVEINTSFYRHHQAKTYARWAASVPDDFRFAVKLAKKFTHEDRLRTPALELAESLDSISHLGQKLGVLLVQLPPSLQLELSNAWNFFSSIRRVYDGPVALEPRHATWSEPMALDLMREFRLTRVFADPDPIPVLARERPRAGFDYFRLHGSPEVYRSNYDTPALDFYERSLRESTVGDLWCIFDNTTFGYATLNAHELKTRLHQARTRIGNPPQPQAGF